MCIELNSQPVGMERVGKNIVVGCMDETLQCYTTKVCSAFLPWSSIHLVLLKIQYTLKPLALGELLDKIHTNVNYCYTKLVLCSKNCFAFPPQHFGPYRSLELSCIISFDTFAGLLLN